MQRISMRRRGFALERVLVVLTILFLITGLVGPRIVSAQEPAASRSGPILMYPSASTPTAGGRACIADPSRAG